MNNANSSPQSLLSDISSIHGAVSKNWSDDRRKPYSKSVSRKTSTLKPFEVMQASIHSGTKATNTVNVQVPT